MIYKIVINILNKKDNELDFFVNGTKWSIRIASKNLKKSQVVY